MRKLLLPLIAALILLPTAASHAAISEVPVLGDAKPSCEGIAANDCRVLVVRQTAFQAKVGTAKNYSVIPRAGHLVAWSVALLDLSDSTYKTVVKNYGAAPRAGIVVLDSLGKSRYKVAEKGPMVTLTRYLGTTPMFALPEAIPVKKGQVVALTVSTWAPVLQFGFGADTSWRGSRSMKESSSENFGTQRALVGSTTQGDFSALYQRVRLAYGATFIPRPTPKSTKKTSKKSSKSSR